MSSYRDININPRPFGENESKEGDDNDNNENDNNIISAEAFEKEKIAQLREDVDPEVMDVLNDLIETVERQDTDSEVEDVVESIVSQLETEEKESISFSEMADADIIALLGKKNVDEEDSDSDDEETARKLEEADARAKLAKEEEEKVEKTKEQKLRRDNQGVRRTEALKQWQKFSQKDQRAIGIALEIEKRMKELQSMLKLVFGDDKASEFIQQDRWELCGKQWHSLCHKIRKKKKQNKALQLTLDIIDDLENSMDNSRGGNELPDDIKTLLDSIASDLSELHVHSEILFVLDENIQILEVMNLLVSNAHLEDSIEKKEKIVVEETLNDLVDVVSSIEEMILDIDSGAIDCTYEGPPLVFNPKMLSPDNPYRYELGMSSKKKKKERVKVRFFEEKDSAEDLPLDIDSLSKEFGSSKKLQSEEEDEKALPAHVLFPNHFRAPEDASDKEISISSVNRDLNSINDSENGEQGESDSDSDSDDEDALPKSFEDLFFELDIPSEHANNLKEQGIQVASLKEGMVTKDMLKKLLPNRKHRDQVENWIKVGNEAFKKRATNLKTLQTKLKRIVANSIHELFAGLKIPERFADFFVASNVTLSDLPSLGSSKIKKLLKSNDIAKTRLLEYIKICGEDLKKRKEDLKVLEEKEKIAAEVLNKEEFQKWLLKHKEEHQKTLEDQSKVVVKEKHSEALILRFESQKKVELPKFGFSKLAKDDRWDVVLRAHERGYASVGELMFATSSYE